MVWSGIMDDQLQELQAQIAQGLLEHEIVVQALRQQSLVSAGCVLVLGLLCFSLWRRCVYLSAALELQTRRHYAELQRRDERHSLDQQSAMMQMLHGFENIVSRKRRG